MFTLGYNTNGLAHHRLEDALPMLAQLGYEAVALTLDVGQLDPFRSTASERAAVRRMAAELNLQLVIETGARYLLDPARKHFPTMLEDSEVDRGRRQDFLRRCIDMAAELGAPMVSIWSGVAPAGELASSPAGEVGKMWDRLCEGTCAALVHARDCGVALAFEPEPGMFVERPAEYSELMSRLGAAGEDLGLTLDLGHLVVTGDLPVEDVIDAFKAKITNVHLDDCPAGVHQHGLFGTGDLDLLAALKALKSIGYEGVASVELSRDSHRGPLVAEQALGQLRSALEICA